MKLRFTIRDLFWLVLIAVVAFSWWFDHRQMTDAMRSSYRALIDSPDFGQPTPTTHHYDRFLPADQLERAQAASDDLKTTRFTELEQALHDPQDGPVLWSILKSYGFKEEDELPGKWDRWPEK
jgi:hypothetical protein